MEQLIFSYEPQIRVGFFVGVFALAALWERASPHRVLKLSRKLRWTHNLGMVLLNTVIVRVAFPAAAVGMASLSAHRSWGLLNNFAVPLWACSAAGRGGDGLCHLAAACDGARRARVGIYHGQARAGQIGTVIGIHGHTDPHEVARVTSMPMLPFKGEVTDYAINRRNWTAPPTDDPL